MPQSRTVRLVALSIATSGCDHSGSDDAARSGSTSFIEDTGGLPTDGGARSGLDGDFHRKEDR